MVYRVLLGVPACVDDICLERFESWVSKKSMRSHAELLGLTLQDMTAFGNMDDILSVVVGPSEKARASLSIYWGISLFRHEGNGEEARAVPTSYF